MVARGHLNPNGGSGKLESVGKRGAEGHQTRRQESIVGDPRCLLMTNPTLIKIITTIQHGARCMHTGTYDKHTVLLYIIIYIMHNRGGGGQ